MANISQRQYFSDPNRVERWPTREPFTAMAIAPLLEAAALEPAMAVADLGCGGGMATLAAAHLVGTEGRVLGVDISSAMIDLARGRAHPANVTFQEADAQTDQLRGAPFDRIISQFGLMFFEDPVAAFLNLATHLHPHGSLHGVVWQEMEGNLSFMAHRLAAQGFARSTPGGVVGQLGPFAFSDRGRVDAYLVQAGFTEATWQLHSLVRPSTLDEVVTREALLLAGIDESVVDEAYAAAVTELEVVTGADGIVHCPLNVQVLSTSLRRDV